MAQALVALAFFIASFSSFFTIVNPLSTAFVFLTITKGNTKSERNAIAKKACVTSAVVLIIFALAGSIILSFFGITLDAFRIAGGLLVAAVGMQMLHAGKAHFHSKKEQSEAIAKEDTSIIPLAIPMMAGPGAMTTAIVLSGEAASLTSLVFLIASIIAVCVVSYVVLVRASAIQKFLGETGKNVVDKVMGLIVLVIGVQFIINGAHNLAVSWF